MFTSKQKSFIVEGKKKRNALIEATKEAAERAFEENELRGEFKIDTILSGSTGIGKTHNIMKAFKKIKVSPVVIQGNQSIFDFSTMLMLQHYKFQQEKKKNPSLRKLIVIADDCDSFFKNDDTMNILKGMTGKGESRKLQYNKAINEWQLTPEMLSVLDEYRFKSGKLGFEVPCSDIVFVLTTNFTLPTEKYAKDYMSENGPTARANRLNHLAAIRRRFNTKDFMLDKYTNWGWLAEVTLNDALIDDVITGPEAEFKKYIILDWVLNNWDDMTESNLDTIRDLALRMAQYPSDYRDTWESDYTVDRTNKMII
jgi:hypothetical protein